jgi:AcrR family transcriptional regulator
MMHTDSTNVNRKAAQSEATRARLLAAARPLFASEGYAGVGTEAIVRTAGVTRGALYHQFADKRDLFRAVFEQVEGELVQTIAARALEVGAEESIEGLRAGVQAWLEASMDPEVSRIVLLDAPAVLGWEEWRKIGEAHGLGLVIGALEGAMEAGAIKRRPVRALAHVIVGALDEAALYVARAEDPVAAREEAAAVLDVLVDGLV